MADVPALRRASSMLRMLALSPGAVTAAEFSAALDIPRSTVYDILAVLEDLRYMRKRKDGFLLGPVMSGLGTSYQRSLPLVQVAAPGMRTLADTLDACVHLTILRGTEAQIIAIDSGPNAVPCAGWAGDTVPANRTPAGRALLSRIQESQVTELFGDADTVELIEEMSTVRTCGYAFNRTGGDDGVWTVAVPMYINSQSRLAAISVALPVSKWSTANEEQVFRAVKLAASRLTARLG